MTMSNFVRVAKKSEIEDLGLKVMVGGEEVLLIKKGEQVFAFTNTCSHQEMELRGGNIEGDAWVCPHHGARFELATGRAVSMPAVEDIQTYNVKCEGDEVFVEER
jgi:3-phenylpropionate/trans-cinnamate dioxygenase ferredoxin component